MIYHYSKRAQKNDRQQEIQRNEKYFSENSLTNIIPIWRNYAEKTASSLFVEQSQGKLDMLLINSKRFEISKEDIPIKLALGMAAYVGIEMAENELQMRVSYSVKI